MTPATFRASRKGAGMTVAKCAAYLGLSKRTIESYESGATKIHPCAVKQMHQLTAQPVADGWRPSGGLFDAVEGVLHFADAVAYRDDTLSMSLRGWLNELDQQWKRVAPASNKGGEDE